MGRKNQHRFHGDPERFEILARFINEEYQERVHYIADVAGGQGMLCRILNKKYNYESEVIDPRGWTLKGIPNRCEIFDPAMSNFYDLIVGLHPDEALRPVCESAIKKPVILIPCCNFWSDEKLGRDELITAIEKYYQGKGISFKRITFPFKGPKNIGIVSSPAEK